MSADERPRTGLPPQPTGLPPKPVDYRRVLTYFLKKRDKNRLAEVDKLLASHKGKEPKLMLTLARKYDCSNPLNRIFVDRFSCPDRYDDAGYLALTRLYLSVFYPQDVGEAPKLCQAYRGKEDELFRKLSSNFLAVNPLKTKKKKDDDDGRIDYDKVLTAVFEKHDKDKVADVAGILDKCKGKEAILFSVLALKYDAPNALNAVFERQLRAAECHDHPALLKLYLRIFHPSCVPDAKNMLSKYQGREDELYAKLSAKFRACNPLDSCAKLGKAVLESWAEDYASEEEEGENEEARGPVASPKKARPAVIEPEGRSAAFATPKRGARARRMPQSPAVTP